METITCFKPAAPTPYYLVRMRVMPILMFVSISSLFILVCFYALVPTLRDMQVIKMLVNNYDCKVICRDSIHIKNSQTTGGEYGYDSHHCCKIRLG